MKPKDEFQNLINHHKTDLYWVVPDNLYVLDEGGETPPLAENWFFIVYTSRTGSTVLTDLLSFHDDILCTSENNVLTNFNAVLRSNFIYTPDCRINWRTKKPHRMTAQDYRELMETWRRIKIRHDKPQAKIFGDKSWIYEDRFGNSSCLEMSKKIFPGSRWIMTYRENILDQISSLLNQRWYSIPENEDELMDQIYNEVTYTLETNDFIRQHAPVGVKFENMVSMDGFVQEMTPVLEYLGADHLKYPWVKAFRICHHDKSVGRWQSDPIIKRLLDKYPSLEALT